MWADAEQYLDYLDTAATAPDSPAAARLNNVIKRVNKDTDIDIQLLAYTTRRIIAAECSQFLESTSLKLETWQPYIHWASLLDINHTIITFNYDRVLETLSDDSSDSLAVRIGLCSYVGLPSYSKGERMDQDVASVIKLHGSVDWRIDSSQVHNIERGKPLEALLCDPNQLMIATPGPTKRMMVQDSFKILWREAEKALKSADNIFFIGYRFPPTDAEARSRLLGALRKNESPDLRLYTVLGPDNDADSRRLKELLRYVTEGEAEVERLPLWAQDFMSIYNPDFMLNSISILKPNKT